MVTKGPYLVPEDKHGMKTEHSQVDIKRAHLAQDTLTFFNSPETVIGLFDICFAVCTRSRKQFKA